LGFDETRCKENLIMDESFPKAPNLMSTSLDPHIEETMEFQTQAKVDDVMKVQVHVHKIEATEVVPMETRSSVGSLYMHLESE